MKLFKKIAIGFCVAFTCIAAVIYGYFLYGMDAMQHGCSGKHLWELN